MDNLGAGKLLVAEPFMMDSVFKRTVLLLCEHDQKLGSIGYILNKPLEVKLKNLIPELSDFNVPVHYGGPVATDTLHYVHTKGDVLDNSVDLGDGVYWGGDFSKLVFLIENKIITRKDIKFFLGYSGWSEGQLVEEMETKSWVITDMDFNYIFDINFNKLWSKVLNNMGNGYAVIGDMTEAVSLN